MRHSLKYCIILLVLSLTQVMASAQQLFLPDARGVGLGGSLVAQSRDAAGIFWNPALLSGLKTSTFVATVNDPFEFNLLAGSHYLPTFGTFGVGLVRVPGTPERLDRGSLAWGRSMNERISLGGSVNLEETGGRWFGSANWGAFFGNADIGAPERGWYRKPDMKWDDRLGFGLAVHGIPLSSPSVSTSALLGLSYVFPMTGVLLNAGYHIREGENSEHLGVGFQLPGRLSLFAGIEDFELDKASFGAAYRLDLFSFSMAYSGATDRLLFTLSTRVGPDRRSLARPHMKAGIRQIKTGNYGAASRSLKKYLSYDLADAKSDSVRQIVFALDRRSDKISHMVDSLLTVAATLLNPEEPKFLRAALIYARILELNPGQDEARMQLQALKPAIAAFARETIDEGILRFESNQFLAAKKMFNRVLMLDKGNSTALYYLSNIDTILKDNGQEHYLSGIGYFKQGNYEEALGQFEAAAQLSPKIEGLQGYLVETRQRIGARRSRIDDLFVEARRLEQAGEYVPATNQYRSILKIEKGNAAAQSAVARLRPRVNKFANAQYRKGMTLYQQDDLRGALAVLSEVMAMNPKHKGAATGLRKVRKDIGAKTTSLLAEAQAAREQGDLRKELDLYEQALTLEPGNPEAQRQRKVARKEVRIRDLVSEARREAGRGKFNHALEILQSALEISPADNRVERELQVVKKRKEREIVSLFNGAISLYTQDKYQEAEVEFKKVLELDAGHVGALKYLQQVEEAMIAIKRLN